MTKGNSSSSKRLETKDLRKVANWTKTHLKKLQEDNVPVCLEQSNGDYLVGKYRVEKVGNSSWKVDEDEFADKRSAILYCILHSDGKFAAAEDLKRADRLVSVLDFERYSFRVRLDNAHAMGNQFKIDLYGSRYEEAKRNLKHAKLDLEKIISRAKYIHEHHLG